MKINVQVVRLATVYDVLKEIKDRGRISRQHHVGVDRRLGGGVWKQCEHNPFEGKW